MNAPPFGAVPLGVHSGEASLPASALAAMFPMVPYDGSDASGEQPRKPKRRRNGTVCTACRKVRLRPGGLGLWRDVRRPVTRVNEDASRLFVRFWQDALPHVC
jgi:hypothetical protein